MKKNIHGILRLARYREYFFFVIVTTLVGAIVSHATVSWRLLAVLVANWLAVGFAFMINDVEDAPEDAQNPAKVNRNPVSARDLSPKLAWIASIGVALLSALVYSLLGLKPFLVGLLCLSLGFLYSWRPVRLKTIPILDMASHCLMLAGLQYLAAYFTFEAVPITRWLFPFLFTISISVYGELFNELRDLEEDVKAGVRHTASVLGPRLTNALMLSFLVIGVTSAAITVFYIKLVPLWVLSLVCIFAAILMVPPMLRIRSHKSSIILQESLQKPLEIATAFALMIQFLGMRFINLINYYGVMNLINSINAKLF